MGEIIFNPLNDEGSFTITKGEGVTNYDWAVGLLAFLVLYLGFMALAWLALG
ncbi:MAG: hypothetical protein ACXABY_22995 [Candidatus Thorarchaeota archaeon]